MRRSPPTTRWLLKGVQAWDRYRLRALAARHPGLDVPPDASSNFAVARIAMAPAARLLRDPREVRTESSCRFGAVQ